MLINSISQESINIQQKKTATISDHASFPLFVFQAIFPTNAKVSAKNAVKSLSDEAALKSPQHVAVSMFGNLLSDDLW